MWKVSVKKSMLSNEKKEKDILCNSRNKKI